jgi:hypothetical protein
MIFDHAKLGSIKTLPALSYFDLLSFFLGKKRNLPVESQVLIRGLLMEKFSNYPL